MGKKKSDALYNRMRNGKEDLEKYYKERERFCNKTTCAGHDLADHEEMNADINKINWVTIDRINIEQSKARIGMVSDFVGSSILPDDKRKFDDKWNAKFLEIGKYMEEQSQALKKEREDKAQKLEELKDAMGECLTRWRESTRAKEGEHSELVKEQRECFYAQPHPTAEEEKVKFKRPKLSDIVDKAKLKCEIFRWKKLTRIAKTYVLMMTLWVIAHVGIRLFMHIFYDAKIDLIRILILWTGLGIGSVIHWACNRKIESLMVKAYAKDKDWADRIREELKGWDLRC